MLAFTEQVPQKMGSELHPAVDGPNLWLLVGVSARREPLNEDSPAPSMMGAESDGRQPLGPAASDEALHEKHLNYPGGDVVAELQAAERSDGVWNLGGERHGPEWVLLTEESDPEADLSEVIGAVLSVRDPAERVGALLRTDGLDRDALGSA